MTKSNADSANDTGLTAGTYLGAMQNKAMQLECLLDAINAFQSAEETNVRVLLVEMAQEISSDLNAGLDNVNLPRLTP